MAETATENGTTGVSEKETKVKCSPVKELKETVQSSDKVADSSVKESIKTESSVKESTKTESSVKESIKTESSVKESTKSESSVKESTKTESSVKESTKTENGHCSPVKESAEDENTISKPVEELTEKENAKSSPEKLKTENANCSPVKKSTSVSPKSSPTKKDIDIATQALNHLAQGKRHLLVNDISSAVNSLQEACRLLAEHYGETAPECADAYFYYGKALLELARIENGVLGNALDGEEGGSTEEENDDDSQEGESPEDQEGQEEMSQDEDDAKVEGEDEMEGEKTEEDEEEVGNLQLAWEMLELAKHIYQKQEISNPSVSLKIAQVYLKLGEIGLENENYQGSIEDFLQCLSIQRKELKPDDRCIAESNYQLGVAYSFADNFDSAIGAFGAACDVVELRTLNLKQRMKEKAAWTEAEKKKYAEECPDPFYTEQGEIDELAKLLPEIQEKIVDMEEMKKDSKEKLQKFKESSIFANILRGGSKSDDGASTSAEVSTVFASPKSCPPSDKPASNITHLVRKKRKPEEEAEKVEQKKPKVENCDALETTTTNGPEKVDASPSEDEKMDVEPVPS